MSTGDCADNISVRDSESVVSCQDFRPEAGDQCCQPKKIRYLQPARREPIRPQAQFEKPCSTVEVGTVYKNSYPGFAADEMASSRMPPIKPSPQLQKSDGCFLTDTVHAISFQAPCNIERVQPIRPQGHTMLGQGPMQGLTTQKHDFVSKVAAKRQKILPSHKIGRASGVLEHQTVQKLSFERPDYAKFEPAHNFRPNRAYKQPTERMESETVQKLSFVPVCPVPKEHLPWAVRVRHAPEGRIESGTTYKYSFLPVCEDSRPQKVVPASNLELITTSRHFDANTVYKSSFLPESVRRPDAILPRPQFEMPGEAKHPVETVYKLSFPLQLAVERTMPIRPRQRSMLGEGPMQELTTQKHDFVCKRGEKCEPIRPRDLIQRSTSQMDACTVNKLSFQSNIMDNYVPTKSCRPVLAYQKSMEPMASDTVQKSSFQPVPLRPKDPQPWAERGKFVMPTTRMASDTVNKLSYQPPGCFVEDDTAGNCYVGFSAPPCPFPQAGIVSG